MSDPGFQNVAVIGSGTMGAGIAQVCAAAGSTVQLQDISQDLLDKARGKIESFLAKGVAKGKATEAQKATTLANIYTTVDLDAAVKNADIVVEAVPEDAQLKNGLFKEVAAQCGEDTVLATNTSSLSLAKVFAGVLRPARCLGTHFFNPPPLMPLLEVVQTPQTAPAAVERVLAWAKTIGKDPIVINDSPGFATSRLGVVLGLEAIRMVAAGVAAPADIDKAMELGYRHPMGPLRLTDLVGLDVRMAIADYLNEALDSPAFQVPQLMRDMVADGHLGKKAGKGFYDWPVS
ncbi:MAG: 3-hydroxyacyl-CoA dehydrogenase family protein [Planctomycetota bacterium]|jgi:3-hydroxybutyryl-CoA dehydrogenase